MAWPPFPPLPALPPLIDPSTSDSVRIRRVVSTSSGRIGGRQFAYSGWSEAVPCSIKGIKATDVRTQMREHEVITYEVTFDTDPGVGDRDQFSWDDVGKILTVQSVKLLGDPTTRTWVVSCEEDR